MVFLLLAKDETEMAPIVLKAFGDAALRFGPGQWIVSAPGVSTTKGAWEKLTEGLSTQPTGMVCQMMGGYYGFAPRSIWEWISAKQQAES